MEATALSLAKLTLDTVLPVAKSALADEAMLLLGVHDEVSFITNELEMMQAFLRAAGAGARNEIVGIWVKQVRDLAYDVEDCLLEYLALDPLVGCNCRSPPFVGGWLMACAFPAATAAHLRGQHQIAVRIRQVKRMVEEVSERNRRYNIVLLPGPAPNPATSVEDNAILSRDFAADVATEESQLVGRDSERGDLVGRLVGSQGGAALQVLAVYGMSGMGKTVLARAVLWSPELAHVFQVRAWVTVPHPLGMAMADFIRSLARQLDVVVRGGASLHEAVVRQLRDRRYAVVVDDVSSVAEWDQIRKVLPDGKRGSWIIATTRDKDVARFCSTQPGHVYELGSLGDEDSLRLLCKKVQLSDGLSMTMSELKEKAGSILERCCGLPLAVAAVGKLLATNMNSPVEWKKLHDHLGTELKNNPGFESIKDVLTSSYDALPYHLKSCFLYLSVFLKYRELRQTRVSWRWMAEGLVGESPDMDPEDVGEGYFNQLISRCMIQPATTWVNLDDRINTGQVHDMMREIILAKSAEENQLFVLNNRPFPAVQRPREKVRHLVVSSGAECRWRPGNNILESMSNVSHVRSLTVDGECPPRLIIPSKMKMMRVLDLEDCSNVTDGHIADVGELRHLKYLGLRRTGITRLPESLGRLKFLQSIDVRGTKVSAIPQGVTKLEKLRHIIAGHGMRHDDNNKSRSGVRLPDGFGRLMSLHNLGRVVIGKDGQRILKEISRLVGLSNLEITELTDKDGLDFGNTIRELVGLRDLEVRAKGAGIVRHASLRFLESMASPPPHLVTLRLFGYLGRLPRWVESLQGVTKIKLLTTELQQDAVEVLGQLPSLTGLHLWRQSYVGQRLHLRAAGKFPKLKLLNIDRLDDLESLVFEEHSVPSLQWLWLKGCRALSNGDDGVFGLTFLPRLKEVRVKLNNGDKPRLHEALRTQLFNHPNRPQFEYVLSM
uniref:Uncharacterized protein n=1 Tax=Avena sativa TaxID=4498 RepID=A0ACD5UEY1_AVESA